MAQRNNSYFFSKVIPRKTIFNGKRKFMRYKCKALLKQALLNNQSNIKEWCLKTMVDIGV